MLQACQYVKSQKAVYSLGKVSSATTWVINNAEPSQFKFTIHYKGGDPTGDQGGDGERYMCMLVSSLLEVLLVHTCTCILAIMQACTCTCTCVSKAVSTCTCSV